MNYGTVVDTVAAAGTVIALFFAVAAYVIARRQTRLVFELEVLRELADVLRDAPDDESIFVETGLSRDVRSAEFNRRYRYILSEYIHFRAGHLLPLVPQGKTQELSSWEACRREEWGALEAAAFPDQGDKDPTDSIFYRRAVERQLRGEVLDSIRRRMR